MIWKQGGEWLDGTVVWLAVGKKLPAPDGQRWPSPFEYSMYNFGESYDCHANFMTPDEYLYDYLPRVCMREATEVDPR